MQETKKYENDQIIEWRWGTDHELMPQPYWTSIFLVDGLLIDAGAPAGAADILEFVQSLPEPEKPEACIVTHAHEDHAGGGKVLSEEFGIPVYAHEKALKYIHEGMTYPDYRQLAWGEKMEPAPLVQPLPPSPISSTSKKFTFSFFPMQGHAPCLVALIEREFGWAFVADGVLPKYQMIFGNQSNIQEDIRQIYDSIVKLQEFTEDLPNLKIFIAGQGMFSNGQELLASKIQEIETMHQKAHDLRLEGFKNRKILRKMFGGESFIGTFTRGDLSRMNLLKSLLTWPIN